MEIFATIGWLVLAVPLAWVSILCFFVTVPTFGEAAFSGEWYQKLGGVIFWLVVIAAWIYWLSFISVDVNMTLPTGRNN